MIFFSAYHSALFIFIFKLSGDLPPHLTHFNKLYHHRHAVNCYESEAKAAYQRLKVNVTTFRTHGSEDAALFICISG